jgi:hypothetical protein
MSNPRTPRLARLFIEAMAKHLPPSASQLRLIDVDGAAGGVLTLARTDLEVVAVENAAEGDWGVAPESADAVVAFNNTLQPHLLDAALLALRPGGRLIIMETSGEPDEARVHTLETAGYTRILVESGIECPLPTGVLMRGEKPHLTEDTAARVQGVASADQDAQTLADYRGRYVHLLVMQTPNKPAWALDAGETLRWEAVTLNGALLAFTSLPKAVAFMQPAVVAGVIRDVNKVAKFSKATALTWTLPVLLNPSLDSIDIDGAALAQIKIDPATAEKSDE